MWAATGFSGCLHHHHGCEPKVFCGFAVKIPVCGVAVKIPVGIPQVLQLQVPTRIQVVLRSQDLGWEYVASWAGSQLEYLKFVASRSRFWLEYLKFCGCMGYFKFCGVVRIPVGIPQVLWFCGQDPVGIP